MDPQQFAQSVQIPPPSQPTRSWFAVVLVIGGVVLVVGVVFAVLFFRGGGDGSDDTSEDLSQSSDNAVVEDTLQVEVLKEDPIPEDQDRDGLTAEEEATYGTDDYEYDTDGDGLSDLQEIELYKTDPTNPDTDGDSFFDGVEIINKYNPNGDGPLE